MKLPEERLQEAVCDLGVNTLYEKGKRIIVKKCWHFSTDGNMADVLFYDEEDFIDGMNRIYLLSRKFKVIILAFCLMDNHVHFCIYGEFEDCQAFMHEYMRMLAMRIRQRHGEANKCAEIPINYQTIDNDFYLKNVICYIVKNAPSAGLSYMAYDYPWCSGSLYFRKSNLWTSPVWVGQSKPAKDNLTIRGTRQLLKSKAKSEAPISMIGRLISPDEYVSVELVERIFKTPRGFSYFLHASKEDEIEGLEGRISRLTIPDRELRQHKRELCSKMYGVESTYNLSTKQRIKIAKALRSKYNCSAKQVAKTVGLVFSEVKDMI